MFDFGMEGLAKTDPYCSKCKEEFQSGVNQEKERIIGILEKEIIEPKLGEELDISVAYVNERLDELINKIKEGMKICPDCAEKSNK